MIQQSNPPDIASGSTRSESPALIGHARALLCIFSIWLVFLSFYPLRLVGSLHEFTERLWQGVTDPFVITGMFKHVVAFTIFGFLIALTRPVQNARRHVMWAAGTLLAISVLIEIGQAAIPARHCRAGDVLYHTVSGTLGAIVAVAVVNHAWFIRAFKALLWPTRFAVLSAIIIGIVGMIVASGPLGSSLANWNASHSLILGNEHSGERPWRGELHGVAIYERALDADDAARLASLSMTARHDSEIRRDMGAIVVLPIDEVGGPTIRNVIEGVPPFSMSIAPRESARWRESGGLLLDGRGALQANDASEWLVERLRDANAFSIEVRCAVDGLDQDGPARIVSLSQDVSYRNMTLGQDGAALVLRTRTPLNGRNGSRLPGVWPGVFTDHERRHLLVTFDGAEMRAFVSGREQAPAQSLQSISLALGVNHSLAAPVAAILFFVPLGIIGAVIWHHRAFIRRIVSIVVVGVFPVILAITVMWFLFERLTAPVALLLWAIPAVILGDQINAMLFKASVSTATPVLRRSGAS